FVGEIDLTGELMVGGRAALGGDMRKFQKRYGLQLWLYEGSWDKMITVICFHKHCCSTQKEGL
ncbi:Uncharacterized protein DAT39_006420, partial [Clarias magur]